MGCDGKLNEDGPDENCDQHGAIVRLQKAYPGLKLEHVGGGVYNVLGDTNWRPQPPPPPKKQHIAEYPFTGLPPVVRCNLVNPLTLSSISGSTKAFISFCTTVYRKEPEKWYPPRLIIRASSEESLNNAIAYLDKFVGKDTTMRQTSNSLLPAIQST